MSEMLETKMSGMTEDDEIALLFNLHRPLLERAETSEVSCETSNLDDHIGELVDLEEINYSEMDLDQMETYLEDQRDMNETTGNLNHENDKLNREFEDLMDEAIILQKIKSFKAQTIFFTSLAERISKKPQGTAQGVVSDDQSNAGVQLVSHESNLTSYRSSLDDQIQATIEINVTMQITLGELEEKLMSELDINKNQQDDVGAAIANHLETRLTKNAYDSKSKRRSFRTWYYKFGIPYFKNERYFKCPPNEDYKERVQNKEFITMDLPRVIKWRNEHKIILENAVKICLMNEAIEKYKKSSNYFKLKAESLKDLPIQQVSVVKQELESIASVINEIQGLSYKTLIAKEHPDREYDWLKISATEFNGIFSDEECRKMWHIYVKPSINKKKWTETEDDKLVQLATYHSNKNWDTIADALGTKRSGYQCILHYQTRLNASLRKCGKWTDEEDEWLKDLVEQFRIGDFIPWRRVAYYITSRNRTQVKVRWSTCLDPAITKGRFTKEEDLTILAGIKSFGMKYHELADVIRNRTPSQIRERFTRCLEVKPNLRIGVWSKEEDKLLLELVKKYGESNWSLVSRHLRTRDRTQVRHRYRTITSILHKNPDIKHVDDIKRRIYTGPQENLGKVFKNKASLLSTISEKLKDRKLCGNKYFNSVLEVPVPKKNCSELGKLAESNIKTFFNDSCFFPKKWMAKWKYTVEDMSELGKTAEALCMFLAVQFNYSGSREFLNDERLPLHIKGVVKWLETHKVCEFKAAERNVGGHDVLCTESNACCSTATENIAFKYRSNECNSEIDLPKDKIAKMYEVNNVLTLVPQSQMSVRTLVETPLYLFAHLNLATELDEDAPAIPLMPIKKITIPTLSKDKNSRKVIQLPKVHYCIPPNVTTLIALKTVLYSRDKIQRCMVTEEPIKMRYDDIQNENKESTAEQSESSNVIRLTKAESVQLWQDRLFSILSCPITMSRNAPGIIRPDSILYSGSNYQYDVFVQSLQNSVKENRNAGSKHKLKSCPQQKKPKGRQENRKKVPPSSSQVKVKSVKKHRSLQAVNKKCKNDNEDTI